MTLFANIVFWVFIACVVLYVLIKLINLSVYNKIVQPRIVDEHTTLSDVEVNDLAKKYLEYLKSDLELEYASHDEYVPIYDHLDEKEKKIIIPKWYMSSVAYELDYVFASIWFNSSVHKKNKFAKTWRTRAVSIPFYATVFFIISLVIVVPLKLINMIGGDTPFVVSQQLMFDIVLSIFSIIGTVCILSYVMCIIYVNTYKNIIEAEYENSLSKFITEHCKLYKEEIIAARHYAISINKVDLRSFRMRKKKAGELKFLGPFVII
ncbi:hypothetical protein [Spiroplasma endosymbiont of Othius punctulatus]|uniref:hypothetical protein n=1 Tax=Spiroplasma endosymbiont of Othius punctulatus TaxID=3066289 RepID=UPI0030D3AB83